MDMFNINTSNVYTVGKGVKGRVIITHNATGERVVVSFFEPVRGVTFDQLPPKEGQNE